MKKKARILFTTILLLHASVLFVSRFASAQSTTLFVNPPTTTVLVGKSFTISLNVSYIDDLAGYYIYLGYNTTVLTATEIIVDGTWFTTGNPYTVWTKEIDDTKGIVRVSVTLTGVEEGVSGSGDLFRIVFTADSTGSSLLDIYNDSLVDPLFDAIPHSTSDGTVEVTAHDVAVYNVLTSKTIVGQSFTLHVNVTVKNEGTFVETFNVTVYANTTTIQKQAVTLASKGSTTITFTWDTTDFAKGNYNVKAYATPVPSEVDMTDNNSEDGTVMVTIPGDINGDKIVNVLDLHALGKAYGSTPSSPSWNPNADINDDNRIDKPDLSITEKNYGKTT